MLSQVYLVMKEGLHAVTHLNPLNVTSFMGSSLYFPTLGYIKCINMKEGLAVDTKSLNITRMTSFMKDLFDDNNELYFLSKVSPGRIVILTIKDEATFQMKQPARCQFHLQHT